MEVQKSFEIGGTVFNSAASFKALISAASQDDVQPQALIAAEALGNIMTVAPVRISEAIDALGGNESIRMENLKLVFGLSSGGIRKIVRNSTGLIKFFLLITTLKLCFRDEEIADFAFAALDKHQLLNHYPVSSSQLQRLVTQLSGHTDSILPIGLLQQNASELAVALDCNLIYHHGTALLADLVMRVFTELQDETTTSIELAGHSNAIWLSTTMFWLLEGNVQVLADNVEMLGCPEPKVCINILAHSGNDDWTIRSFRKALPALEYVFLAEHHNSQYFSRIPQRLAVHLIDNHCSVGRHQSQRELYRRVCTVLSHALIVVLLQKGRLNMHGVDRTSEIFSHNSTTLAAILPLHEKDVVESISTLYGLPELSLEEDRLAAGLASHLLEFWRSSDSWDLGARRAHKWIQTTCGDLFDLSAVDPDRLMSASVYITLDAILTFGTDRRYGNRTCQRFLPMLNAMTVREQTQLFHEILWNGIDPGRFCAAAMQAILPGISPPPASMLIVHFDGTVVGFIRFWRPDFRKQGMLSLMCFPGGIRKDGLCYDSIIEGGEIDTRQSSQYTKVANIESVESLLNMPKSDRQFTFETDIAHTGRGLVIRHWLNHVDQESGRRLKRMIHWHAALYALATSYRTNLDVKPHAKDSDELLAQSLQLLEPFYTLPREHQATRLVIPTWGSPDLMIIAAATAYRFAISRKASILVHESGSLLATSRLASKNAREFIIIAL